MRLCTDDGGDGVNRLAGVVEDIAYLGDVSVYHLRVGADQTAQMTLANIQPLTEQRLTWGQEVRFEWSPSSAVLLTS